MFIRGIIGDSMIQIRMPITVYAGEATDGSCISNIENFMINQQLVMNPMISIVSNGCTIKQSQRIELASRKFYRRNFTLTCINGSTNHNVTCIVTGHHNEAVLQL